MQWCKGLCSLRQYDPDIRSRAPLDSTVIYPITRSFTKQYETGKIEILSRSYLFLAHKSTWGRWRRSSTPQDAPPFFIVLCLVKIHLLLPHTPRWEKHLFGISSLGLHPHLALINTNSSSFSSLSLDSNKWRSSNAMDTTTNIAQYKH